MNLLNKEPDRDETERKIAELIQKTQAMESQIQTILDDNQKINKKSLPRIRRDRTEKNVE